MTDRKPPKREHLCPDCGKPCVNAHAVKVHRLWKHGSFENTPPKPPPPASPPPAPAKKKEADWWL